ncbi:hypothetical protein POF51_26295 [Brevibacillus sp. AG]|uniref:hypothetical protein n=1 Tax=Brevibacillus sp. AG TaxID=3020891 RepID=UPI00232E84FC|nr:hypothetical protein [Brevibacillus sp. AG]MDC0764234.1 hypothetical protein [Brevibacillus sp. AG]
MIALVLSSRPLQAKEYLPETASIRNAIPEKVDAMNVSTYELMLERLREYEPKIVLVVTSDMSESAYKWIPEVMGCLSKSDQTLFIIPKSEKDQYHLQVVIGELVQVSNWRGQVSLLGFNLTYQEVADQLSGYGQSDGEIQGNTSEENESDEIDELTVLLGATEKAKGRDGYVIALTGPGSAGATTFALYHFPYLAKLNPEKEFLLVDLNEDKKDLVVATNSENYRLDYFITAFQKKKLEKTSFKYNTPYKSIPNLKVINAVQDQHKWTSNEIVMFLDKVRDEFDVIAFDAGQLRTSSNAQIRLLREADKVSVFVRPDSFSLNRTLSFKNILDKLPSEVIITHFDSAYVSKSEIEKYIGLPVMGVVSYERGLIPKLSSTDIMEPPKAIVKDFVSYNWGIELTVVIKRKRLLFN